VRRDPWTATAFVVVVAAFFLRVGALELPAPFYFPSHEVFDAALPSRATLLSFFLIN